MSLGAGLKAFLAAAPQVAGGRIYPLRLPRNWRPVTGEVAVPFERAGGGRLHTFDGPTGNDRPTMRLHVWGKGYSETEAAAKAVKDKLDGYRGLMGAVAVAACRCTLEHNMIDPDTQAFHWVLDFFISYEED